MIYNTITEIPDEAKNIVIDLIKRGAIPIFQENKIYISDSTVETLIILAKCGIL